MRFFIDTSALVALADRRDGAHVESVQFVEANRAHLRMTTSDYVLDETATLLRRRIGHEPTARFIDAILTSKLYQIVRIDHVLWQQAWELFKAYPDQSFSFTDCTSFIVMKAQRISDAFAFDAHFHIAGFATHPASLSE